MPVMSSVAVAMFCLALVFFVLAVLYAMIMGLSRLLGFRLNRKAGTINTSDLTESGEVDWDVDAGHVSSGELKLINVDEKTAAMIMAIVSDESQIPLSELRFKSIKAIEQD